MLRSKCRREANEQAVSALQRWSTPSSGRLRYRINSQKPEKLGVVFGSSNERREDGVVHQELKEEFDLH